MHGWVIGLQAAPHFALSSITANQEVKVHTVLPSLQVLKSSRLGNKVNALQALAILELHPAGESSHEGL